MPSKISDIIEKLSDVVSALLPNATKMPNPYEAALNPDILLRNGFAIAPGEGLNTDRFVGCAMTIERFFVLLLTRQVTTTETNTEAIEDIGKALLEDEITVIRWMEANPSLEGLAMKASFRASTGIQYIGLEDSGRRYMSTAATFAVEYQETLNG